MKIKPQNKFPEQDTGAFWLANGLLIGMIIAIVWFIVWVL